MSKRIGAQTTALPSCPGLIGWAGIAGQKEKEGPYGAKFDWIIPDELNGEQSFEGAERAMLEQAVVLCAEKAGTRLNEIQMLLAGDLLNQIISAGFAARNLGIPFYGLYGACSTMSESLSVGGMLADGGFADRLICATCSHFCTAERQYRAPLELGNQRTPTAQWTVTGAGAVMISGSKHAPGGLDAYDMRARGGSGHYGCEQHGRSHDASGFRYTCGAFQGSEARLCGLRFGGDGRFGALRSRASH